MVPSVDPLPFKVFLGYKRYPTYTNFVAMAEMPLQGANLGEQSVFWQQNLLEVDVTWLTGSLCLSFTEEKYTWILQPKDLKGCTGEHYLVVRPVVGAGVKSINASLTVTAITTACKFWNESNLDWSTYGCRVSMWFFPVRHIYWTLKTKYILFFQGWCSDHTSGHPVPLQPPHLLWGLVLRHSQPRRPFTVGWAVWDLCGESSGRLLRGGTVCCLFLGACLGTTKGYSGCGQGTAHQKALSVRTSFCVCVWFLFVLTVDEAWQLAEHRKE